MAYYHSPEQSQDTSDHHLMNRLATFAVALLIGGGLFFFQAAMHAHAAVQLIK